MHAYSVCVVGELFSMNDNSILIYSLQLGSWDCSVRMYPSIHEKYWQSPAKVKFTNFCGQPGVRVDADRSIYYKEGHERETLIFRLLNLILWYGPRKHYKRVQRVWVDEIINAPRWKDFINQLDNEWLGFTIYVSAWYILSAIEDLASLESTVMLAVDVSFLAVPGIIDSSLQTSPAIAVYMSSLCAVGSLVLAVLLVDQSKDYQTAEDGVCDLFLIQRASLITHAGFIHVPDDQRNSWNGKLGIDA